MRERQPRRISGSPVRRRHPIAALCALLALVGASALGQELSLADLRSRIAREYPEVRWITAEGLDVALRRRPRSRPLLLDARTPEEFALSHLRDAMRIDPDHPDLAALAPQRRRPVVVYCSVGYRSARIGRMLLHEGFVDVHNLEGGIFGWANGGRPVVRDGRIVHDVHPYDDDWGRYLRAELRTRTPR